MRLIERGNSTVVKSCGMKSVRRTPRLQRYFSIKCCSALSLETPPGDFWRENRSVGQLFIQRFAEGRGHDIVGYQKRGVTRNQALRAHSSNPSLFMVVNMTKLKSSPKRRNSFDPISEVMNAGNFRISEDLHMQTRSTAWFLQKFWGVE